MGSLRGLRYQQLQILGKAQGTLCSLLCRQTVLAVVARAANFSDTRVGTGDAQRSESTGERVPQRSKGISTLRRC